MLRFVLLLCCIFATTSTEGADQSGAELYRTQIEPLLSNNCYDCHGYGTAEGGVILDEFESPEAASADPTLWWRALRMVRAGLMPPADHAELAPEDIALLEGWIKTHVFRFNPQQPDPGRVTLRRLNREEYRQTVHDLLGVDYDTRENFPPDDSGHGFDNLGDVLNMSTLHLEKYVQAGKAIADQAVPQTSEDAKHQEFFGGPIPDADQQRRELAEKLLRPLASRAYRRPVDQETLDRITEFAVAGYTERGLSFESAIAESLAAILASPRFLFLIEKTEGSQQEEFPRIDEFSLAARLSYFLWASMPDQELSQLAEEQRLRQELPQQIQRMTADPRWKRFVRQFVGQWLGARDVQHAVIDVVDVLRRDEPPNPEARRLRGRLHELRKIPSEKLTSEQKAELEQVAEDFRKATEKYREIDIGAYASLRPLMRAETERHFEYVFRQDRPLIELLDCDYAFLNARLARHYGIEEVEGDEIRRVDLPADSPRGGVLTQGTMLVTTSNPNRTSPVKRGLYILENILGVPPAPPPPNVPELPDVNSRRSGNVPSLRDSLARHREDPLCSSCHERMDPLGLAFENFNALGAWRDAERGYAIDPSGTLITGRSFENVEQLKRILVEHHRIDFYRCLTEKLLTFAIGRGLDYHDVQTVDAIVEQLEASGGKPSVLVQGIVESAPFQRKRSQRRSL